MKTAAKRPLAEDLIVDMISDLIGMEVLKDRKSLTGAIFTLRQLVIRLEKRGMASKSVAERCFELIQMMERE